MFSPLYKAVGTVVLIVSAFAPADAFVSSPASLSLKGKNAASISARSIVVTPKSSLRDCNLLSGVRSLSAQAEAGTQEEPLTVAMIGATGGVGRLTAAIVRSFGVKVRALVRDPSKGKKLLADDIEIVTADVTKKETLAQALRGVDAVVLTSGTTAFPTNRWNGGNNPKAVNDIGVKNVVDAIAQVNTAAGPEGRRIKKVTLLTSIGVRRKDKFPFSILNSFGVLDSMVEGEDYLIKGADKAGYSYAIVRPGRLIGGPMTNPDFATLLKMEEGALTGVECRPGDPDGFAGDCSRRTTAEALAQTLVQPVGDVDFSVRSVKGPVLQQQDWDDVFTVLSRGPEALRLEFSTLDVPKFKKWLTSWGNGILTSGALFPPLPMPFRVDYPKDPAVGLDLEFLSVTVNGEVSETGKLELRVVEGVREPFALVAKRVPEQAAAFPGEEQLLQQLQDDLYRVTQNSQGTGEKGGVWGV